MHPNYTHRGRLALERRRQELRVRRMRRRGKVVVTSTPSDVSRKLAESREPQPHNPPGPGRARARAHARKQQALAAAPVRDYCEGRRTTHWAKWRQVREATLEEFFKALEGRTQAELLKGLEKTAWYKAYREAGFPALPPIDDRPGLRKFVISRIVMDAFPHPVQGDPGARRARR